MARLRVARIVSGRPNLLVVRADEMQVFSGHRDLEGGWIQKNSAKRCVFSHPNLNLKKKSPFQAIVKKRGPGGQGVSGVLVGVHQKAVRW